MKLFIVWVVIVLSLVGVFTVSAVFAGTLSWDRNSESDMSDYRIYACFSPGCTVTRDATTLRGTVAQTAVGVRPSFVLPNGVSGNVAVTARDTVGNESGLSASVSFFDQTAPGAPTGLSVAP